MTNVAYIRGFIKPRDFMDTNPNRLELIQAESDPLIIQETEQQNPPAGNLFPLLAIGLLLLIIKK